MFTIRLRKGSKTGAKVGEFGKFATQAEALAQAQVIANAMPLAPGVKVVVERVRGGSTKAKRRTNARKTRRNGFNESRDLDPQQQEIMHEVVLTAENDGRFYDVRDYSGAVDAAIRELRRNEEERIREDAKVIRPLAIKELRSRWGPKSRPNPRYRHLSRARTNPKGASASSFKGHQIRRSAAGYTVLPYGHVFPALKAARAWLTQHVAAASRRNPKGGRLLLPWGKRVARVGRQVAGAISNPSHTSHVPRTNRRSIATTQSVLFPVTRFTVEQARSWLRKHGKNDGVSVDTTADFHRFRQADPGSFQAGSFRTISLGRSGVKAIIGRPL
jgi:hypothetical protein